MQHSIDWSTLNIYQQLSYLRLSLIAKILIYYPKLDLESTFFGCQSLLLLETDLIVSNESTCSSVNQISKALFLKVRNLIHYEFDIVSFF